MAKEAAEKRRQIKKERMQKVQQSLEFAKEKHLKRNSDPQMSFEAVVRRTNSFKATPKHLCCAFCNQRLAEPEPEAKGPSLSY